MATRDISADEADKARDLKGQKSGGERNLKLWGEILL